MSVMGQTHRSSAGQKGDEAKGVALTLKRRQPIILTVVRLVEKLLNGQLPGQKEVSKRLTRRAVLQEHDGTQGFCHRLV